MNTIKLVLVLSLMLTMAGFAAADMSTDQNQGANQTPGMSQGTTQPNAGTTCPPATTVQPGTEATPAQPGAAEMAPSQQAVPSQPGGAGMPAPNVQVKQGPVVRAGYPASADVFVNGKFALRVPASAGGMTPRQRADIIASRINNAFASGSSWQDTRVAQVNGSWTVQLGSNMIATADSRSARALRVSQGTLASNWARQTVVAMGGQPSMIVAQLQPVRTMVAGSRQQLGAMNWTMSATKSVPLLDQATGSTMGNVTIGGSQAQLDKVNSVVMFQSTLDNNTVWTFVPVSETSTTGTLNRVMGVGLVSVPTALIPTTGYQMGATVTPTIQGGAARWNTLINDQFGQQNLRTGTDTKVVPLYSMDQSQVIGAVQIVGNTADVRRAQSVVVNMGTSDMLNFAVTPSSTTSMTGQPTTLKGAMISAVILMPTAGTAPCTVQPGITPAAPSTTPETTPGMTPSTSGGAETPSPSETPSSGDSGTEPGY